MLVVFYHADLLFSGGFTGVDVFFVISGYLITRIIVSELDSQSFSLAHFWKRRVRRLAPALLFCLIVTTLLAWHVLLPKQYSDLGKVLVTQPLLLTNFFLVKTLEFGYFGSRAPNYPLLHTWSLAVEEQFYVVFPTVMMLLYRPNQKKLFWISIGLAATTSFALSVLVTPFKPVVSFFLLPTRAFELLVGAIAGQTNIRPNRYQGEGLTVLGTLLIAYSALCLKDGDSFPGWIAAMPTLGSAFLLVGTSNKSTLAARLLSWPPLVFIGTISYSLYLWHWPIIAFCKYLMIWSTRVAWSSILGSFLIASVSWRYVEKPFRTSKALESNFSALLFYVIFSLSLITLGGMIVFEDGIPNRVPAKCLAYAGAETDLGNFRRQHTASDISKGDLIKFGRGSSRPTILVWGDSHAMAILPALDILGKRGNFSGESATHSSSPPLNCLNGEGPDVLMKEHQAWVEATWKYIAIRKPEVVLLAARWDEYDHLPGFSRGLDETLARLRTIDCRIGLMLQVPRHRMPVPRALALTTWHPWGLWDFQLTTSEQKARTKDFLTTLARSDLRGVTILDPDRILAQSTQCEVVWNEQCLYRDDNHLSGNGSSILAPLLADFLKGKK